MQIILTTGSWRTTKPSRPRIMTLELGAVLDASQAFIVAWPIRSDADSLEPVVACPSTVPASKDDDEIALGQPCCHRDAGADRSADLDWTSFDQVGGDDVDDVRTVVEA